MYVPEKSKAGHYAHQVDKNNSGEFYVAFTFAHPGIKCPEQIHDAELFEEVKELVKEAGFPKAIDLGDVFSLSQVFGDARLVSVSGAPCEAISDILRCPGDQVHGGNIALDGMGVKRRGGVCI